MMGLFRGAVEVVAVKCCWPGSAEVWLTGCSQHGHRGLHLRDAARGRALGIHPETGPGGHLQTLHHLPGTCSSTYLFAFVFLSMLYYI